MNVSAWGIALLLMIVGVPVVGASIAIVLALGVRLVLGDKQEPVAPSEER